MGEDAIAAGIRLSGAFLARYLRRLLEKVVDFDHLLSARYSASILVMGMYLAVLPALSMSVALLEPITGFPSI